MPVAMHLHLHLHLLLPPQPQTLPHIPTSCGGTTRYAPRLARVLRSSDGPFLAGKLSFVDIQFFYAIDTASRFHADPLKDFPDLLVLFTAVAALPGVAAYMVDPERRFPSPGRDGYYDRVKATMPWLFGEGDPPAMAAERYARSCLPPSALLFPFVLKLTPDSLISANMAEPLAILQQRPTRTRARRNA
jgi:hypothetical protein